MGIPELIAPLAAAPSRCALVLDVDGTLAPIVARPELAAVPQGTRATLASLARRYLLVACVSGRPGEQAAALVGVEGVRYVGNHGLELHPDRDGLACEIARFRATLAGPWPIEDKGLSLSLHFREAADEAAARAALAAVAERAAAAGLDPRWGRKVLEIRPRVAADKGTAVLALVGECGATNGLYAGDDKTDIDGFAGLRGAGLAHAVCIAVDSEEAPTALRRQADVVVSGPAGLARLLELL